MKKWVIYCCITICFSACVKEQQFGASRFKQIFYFSVPSQAGITEIDEDSLIIRIIVDAQADLTQIAPDSIRLSTYATISPATGIAQDFSLPVIYTVRAEDGSTASYKVNITNGAANPQLENSSFDLWYTPGGVNYLEPGSDQNTIWATGNPGVVTIGAPNVTPLTISGSDLGAQLLTRDLGTLGQISGQRMAAGSMFTGDFVLDIANPLNSPRFGIAFTSRPQSFTISYTYAPGTPYRAGNGQILTKVDTCDIYLLLENRTGSVTKRLATGWFRSGESQSNFTSINVPMIYGNLPAGSPSYLFPVNGLFGSSSDPATHLTFVASSSANGAMFEGGTNSTLVLNNLSLIY